MDVSFVPQGDKGDLKGGVEKGQSDEGGDVRATMEKREGGGEVTTTLAH